MNILGRKYSLKLNNSLTEIGLAGRCSYEPPTIEFAEDTSLDVVHTILHEAIHATINRVGVDQTVPIEIIEVLCESIPNMLQDNFDINFKKKK